MSDLSANTVIELQRAENNLLKRYMCREDFCPCSITIDPVLYGDREKEFEGLDRTGTTFKFYEECYKGLIDKQIVQEELSEEILTLIETMEIESKCSGICETSLFWFF